jgi:hypothetical protein
MRWHSLQENPTRDRTHQRHEGHPRPFCTEDRGAIVFTEAIIEDHQIKAKVLLEASLNEVKRNTNTWNMLYALGLIGFTSTAQAVIWCVGNCVVAARAVRQDTTEVYLIVAYRQPGYVWVNGFHPDEAAIAVWNRLAQLWMQANWSRWIRSFDPQARVIKADAEVCVDRRMDDQAVRQFVKERLEIEYRTKRERQREDEFASELDLEWRMLCRDVKLARAFRREQDATRDLALYEAAKDFLYTLPLDDPKPLSTPATEAADRPSQAEHDRFIFRKQGDVWRIVDGTGQEFLLKDMKGLGYIAYLLRHPRQLYRILELAAAVEGVPAANHTRSLADLSEQELDEQGLHFSEGNEGLPAYDQMTKETMAKRLEQLNVDRVQAEANHDTEELARINRETDQIADYLRSGQGLAGRIREQGADADRERSRVWHAVSDAILKIGQHNPDLAQHLKDSIRIQIADSEYRPAVPATWQT